MDYKFYPEYHTKKKKPTNFDIKIKNKLRKKNATIWFIWIFFKILFFGQNFDIY